MGQDIKPFKTVDEQLRILSERGLIIDSPDDARRLLLNLNYYRISAYSLTLRRNDKFNRGIHFSDIMQIYNFDMELRASVLYLLEYIEVSIRTHIGYYHAKKYGPLGYLNGNTFVDETRYRKFKIDCENAIKEYGSKEAFVKHHKESYDGKFPIWVLVELLSFGSLSRLFKNLDKEIQDEICKDNYGRIGEIYIENWLQGFTILRNICAHRGRIYNREIPFGLKLQNRDKKMLAQNNSHLNKSTKQLFVYLLVAQKITTDTNIWQTFMQRFVSLIQKYPFVHLSNYGFPEHWKELMNIKE